MQARILGADVTYKLGAPGRHLVLNSLAVLAAVALAGADLRWPRWRWRRLQPATGRGARITLDRRDGTALLIDESYNANPASMRAALALLGQAEIGAARPAHRGARRHAGARPAGADLHRRTARAGASPTASTWCSAAGR